MIVRQVELSEDIGRRVRSMQGSILRPQGPLPGDDPRPADAVTLAVIEDDDVIHGAVTLAPAAWPAPDLAELPAPQWQLRALAVVPESRGRGIGGVLVDAAADFAGGRSAASIWAQIRVAALRVYLRCGWVVVGDEWDKTGVGPHVYGWVPLR